MFFIVGGHIRPYGETHIVDIACGINSAILHYFMLAYFGWTAAEALNLYFSLVKVFEAKSISHYTVKAGLIIWGMHNYAAIIIFLMLIITVIPLGIVAISAGAGHTFYVNDV